MAEYLNRRQIVRRQTENIFYGQFHRSPNTYGYEQHNQQNSNNYDINQNHIVGNHPVRIEKMSHFIKQSEMNKFNSERLRRLEKQSNTKISVYNTILYPDRSIITVVGTAEQQETATAIINRILCNEDL